MRVYIVLEGPDMTYYGDAMIHGVFTSEDAAKAKLAEIDPTNTGKDWEPKRIEEWDVA